MLALSHASDSAYTFLWLSAMSKQREVGRAEKSPKS